MAIHLKGNLLISTDLKNLIFLLYLAVDVAINYFRFRVCIDFILSLKSYYESLIDTTVKWPSKQSTSNTIHPSKIKATLTKVEVNLTVIKPEILLVSDPTRNNSPYIKCSVSIKCSTRLHDSY